MPEFVKHGSRRQIAFEAAGLRDLRDHGATVADLVWVRDTELATRMIDHAPPTAHTARGLGRMLARLHGTHSRVFGQAPPGFDLGVHGAGTMGGETLPLVTDGARPWGVFYAEDRILPYLQSARDNGSIDQQGTTIITTLAERLRDGDFDTDDPPSILHGDLWSGNVIWSPEGAILIDPASHAGHRESDLAQLAVFGAPLLDDIMAGYEDAYPLGAGWQERVALHQLHILIVHASLFGGPYGTRTVSAAAAYL